MSLESEIVTALSAVAAGRVYPEYAREEVRMPYVVYRRASCEPLLTLAGPGGLTRSSYVFWAWAASPAEAQSVADAVAAAINAATGIETKFQEPVNVDEFEPVPDQYGVPVQFGFWHS